MHVLAYIAGALVIVGVFADLLNTLVTTSTSTGRWWPSNLIGSHSFAVVRGTVGRLPEESRLRERLLSLFGPGLLLLLLAGWILAQTMGFALILWGLGGVDGVADLRDAWYYSGVTYFTVGFGELVPQSGVARLAALLEAGSGVVTTALVIGYLPSLYAAYSARETRLMTIDDGSDDRITPTDLVIAWAPDADPEQINARFADWELWAAGILETHSTLPLLRLFRSHDRRQNWVTALGLLSDAALQAQIIVGCTGRRESYWFLRRAIAAFDAITQDVDVRPYDHHSFGPDDHSNDHLFEDLYRRLAAHGFELLPFEEAHERSRIIRNRFAPQMECLIDHLLCPRGFWPPTGGLLLEEPSCEPSGPR